MTQEGISINKYISSKGLCSRREADKWIEQGRVTINGEVAKKGNRVTSADEVIVDGSYVQRKVKPVYILLNKPIGITCTTNTDDKTNIIDFIDYTQRIFPVGRLDKDSSGLILLTNDGDIVNKILRAENNHEKEYIVKVNKPIGGDFVRKMSNGFRILGQLTMKCKVERINKVTFRIVLKQGLNRQIRRMCQELGYKVQGLERIRIMNIVAPDLKPGRWRKLTKHEESRLKSLVS